MTKNDELGGLWLKQAQSGKRYMSGKLTIDGEAVEVVVFKNENKREGERTPDYRVYRSQPREPAAASQGSSYGQGYATRPNRGQAAAATAAQRPSLAEELDDDIPF